MPIWFLNANIHKVTTEKGKGVTLRALFRRKRTLQAFSLGGRGGYPTIWQRNHFGGFPLPPWPPNFLGKESCRGISIYLRCHNLAKVLESRLSQGVASPQGCWPWGRHDLHVVSQHQRDLACPVPTSWLYQGKEVMPLPLPRSHYQPIWFNTCPSGASLWLLKILAKPC